MIRKLESGKYDGQFRSFNLLYEKGKREGAGQTWPFSSSGLRSSDHLQKERRQPIEFEKGKYCYGKYNLKKYFEGSILVGSPL